MSYQEAASLEHTRVTPADQTKRYTNWNTALKKSTDNAYVYAAVQGKETLAKREPAERGSQFNEENKATRTVLYPLTRTAVFPKSANKGTLLVYNMPFKSQ